MCASLKAASRGGRAVPRRAEGDLLVDVVGVGHDGVVGRHHRSDVDEVLRLRRLAGTWVRSHGIDSATPRAPATPGTAYCAPWPQTGVSWRRCSPAAPSARWPARALEELAAGDPARWPWPTFIVNIVGAFLLGLFVTRLLERLPVSSYRRPFLGTGVCGGLTTFSTMQVETITMLEHGHYGLALSYTAASVAAAWWRSTSRRRWCAGSDPAMTVLVWFGVVVLGGLGAVTRLTVDKAVSRRIAGRFRRHARRQHQRGLPARRARRTGTAPAPGAADRDGLRRLLHDLLDVDAGDTAAG